MERYMSSPQRNRNYKKEPNWNFRTDNSMSDIKKSPDGLN